MSPSRWSRVREVLEGVLDLPREAQPAAVESACGGDLEVRAAVIGLLQAEGAGVLDRAPAACLHLPDDSTVERSLSGQRLGPWLVQQPLGRGGMGDVYQGCRADGAFEQQVAIKVMRSLGPASGLRFRREGEVLASLAHPHITRLLDAGVTPEGVPFLVMELVDGARLDRYCDERRLPIDARLRLFGQVCSAVHYAHQRLVVHRDLKPSNILVQPDGAPKLLDFGIAKLLTPERPAATQSSAAPLTPEYASPEQVRGEAITTATDVYALGVLLYELLSGHHPYESASAQRFELQRAICERDPEAPSTAITRAVVLTADGTPTRTVESVAAARGESGPRLRRRLAGDLDNIVLRAMQKDPQRRYASAEQLADDITRYLAGQPVRARADTLAYRARKFVRRHRGAVLASCLAAVALCGGAIASSLGFWQARRAAQAAATAAQRAAEESAKLGRTLELLREMLAAAHTDREAGPDVRVRDVLDDMARGVGEAGDEPLVQAAVREALGDAYTGLGLFEAAEAEFSAAAALREQHGAGHSADQARTLAQAALVALCQERRDLAAERAERAVALAQAVDPPPSITHALAARSKAMVCLAAGQPFDAELWYGVALDSWRQVRGDRDPHLPELLSGVALALEARRDFSSAERVSREAVALLEELRGRNHPATTLGLLQLARICEQRGELEAAETLLRNALERQRSWWGGRHAGPAVGLHHLGSFLLRQGRPAEAEPLLREALQLRRALLHPRHRLLLQSLRALAELCAAQGRAEEAAGLQREADGGH